MAKTRWTTQLRRWPRQIMIVLIRVYQYLISPWLGRQCRFYPSCSHYALAVIEQQGAIKGCGLAIKRLLKCHPWHRGGIDLPPALEPTTTMSCCPSPTHSNGSK